MVIKIDANVFLGINPTAALTPTSTPPLNEIGIGRGPAGELNFDASIKWMFDYEEAVKKGLACSIRLKPIEAKDGFDKIIVSGIKVKEDDSSVTVVSLREDSQIMLEGLLNGHHYTGDGMEILKIGTPTNNTDDSNAGFNEKDEHNMQSFATQVNQALYSPIINKLDRKDGQWLSEALGVDYNVFEHIKGADGSQTANAITINRALWNATGGHFMDEMMNNIFSDDSIQRTESYFTDYVLGRGMVPSIRVGNQPYGILPTTSFTRWNSPSSFDPTDPSVASDWSTIQHEIKNYLTPNYNSIYESSFAASSQFENFISDKFNDRLTNLFKVLNNNWLEMLHYNGKTIDKINKNNYANSVNPLVDRQKDFMEALGTDATLSEVLYSNDTKCLAV